MSNVKIFVFLLSMVFIGISEGCNCSYFHPQQQYCNAEFVIVAVVKSRVNATSPMRNYHTYTVQSILKATPRARVALATRPRRLYTSIRRPECDTNLGPNSPPLLITGHVVNGKPSTDQCQYIGIWDNMGDGQELFLHTYKNGCSCNIVKDSDPRINSPRTCVFNETTFGVWNCQSMHGACVRRSPKKCNWKSTPELTDCFARYGV